MAISVGIDLGTTFSAVAYIDPITKLPKIIPNQEGNKITPSVIQFHNGKIIFGSEAENALIAGESGCVATFKRSMGSCESYCMIDGISYTAEELSGLLLKHLKEVAESELGEKIKDAVITVPAYFYSIEREATLRAAAIAGIKVKKIIDEPNAAALIYGLNHWRENANILVYDLGGGTFDVTIIRMGKNGVLSTITTRGDHLLGGRDWDSRIEDILYRKFFDETSIDLSTDSANKSAVRGLSEGVKKQLTNMLQANVTLNIPNYGSATITITRDEFEKNTEDLISRTGELCRAVLNEAEINKGELTDILLVGGSTRMPQVSKYLHDTFGKKPITHVNPDEAVALGAAIQANNEAELYSNLSVRLLPDGKKATDHHSLGLNSKAPVKPSQKLSSISMLKMRETTAHAMGIIAISRDGSKFCNEVIIPANHPRPVRYAKKFNFFTSSNSVNELEIYLVQGDSENPLDCIIQNKYVVTGIRHVKRGESIGTLIRVQYSYDHNGIMIVQARQEEDLFDLPIRKELITNDVSVFGNPIVSKFDESNGISSLPNINSFKRSIVHKFKPVTFSNVNWSKYDNIQFHPSGSEFNEPSMHVRAVEDSIEFHGYNVSEMDEGVYYSINSGDDFEIECDINTSDIKPHPGGTVIISLGIISAKLGQYGGDVLLDDSVVSTVGAKFKLKMSVINGEYYEIYIDDNCVGRKKHKSNHAIKICFGLVHGAHYCHLLSHAYISDIVMRHRDSNAIVDNSVDIDDSTNTWDN